MSTNQDIKAKVELSAYLARDARRLDFAMQVRKQMKCLNLRNVDVADRLGVSEANVSRWLRGNQNLGIDTMHALADALDMPLQISLEPVPERASSAAPAVRSNVYDMAPYRRLRPTRAVEGEFVAEPGDKVARC